MSASAQIPYNGGPRSAPSLYIPRHTRPSEARLPAILFPFQGIVFFLSHPFLYPLLRSRILPCFLLSLIVLATLFIFTFLPQVAFLAIFHRGSLAGASAWINGTILVLSEASVIVTILFEAFLVDDTLTDIFDSVLIYRGFGALVSKGRVVFEPNPGNESNVRSPLLSSGGQNDVEAGFLVNPVTCLGELYGRPVYSPFSCRQISEFILLIPLNLIPYIGAPLFLYLTGYRAGPLQHWRYFYLRGLSKPEQKEWVTSHRREYTTFGTVFLVLQLIPVLNMLFLLTSAVGSALWAAALEEQRPYQPSHLPGQDGHSHHPSIHSPPPSSSFGVNGGAHPSSSPNQFSPKYGRPFPGSDNLITGGEGVPNTRLDGHNNYNSNYQLYRGHPHTQAQAQAYFASLNRQQGGYNTFMDQPGPLPPTSSLHKSKYTHNTVSSPSPKHETTGGPEIVSSGESHNLSASPPTPSKVHFKALQQAPLKKHNLEVHESTLAQLDRTLGDRHMNVVSWVSKHDRLSSPPS